MVVVIQNIKQILNLFYVGGDIRSRFDEVTRRGKQKEHWMGHLKSTLPDRNLALGKMLQADSDSTEI